MDKKILVILSSVRPVRAGMKVAEWVMKYTKNRKPGFVYELVDLKKINLPFFDEPVSPREAETYIHKHSRDWSEIVEPADGFIIVTPEYNHGYPPALKNAVDYLYREWKGKPVGFVGYGGSGALDSIRQMKEVLARFRMTFTETQIGISRIWDAFKTGDDPESELVSGSLDIFFDEIEEAALK